MNELSPELKKLMQTARESYSPDEARVTAVREALTLRIAAPGGDAGASASSSAPSAVSTGAAWSKPIAIALVAALGGSALWLGTRSAAPAPAPKAASHGAQAPALAPQAAPPAVVAVEPRIAKDVPASPARVEVAASPEPAGSARSTVVRARPAAVERAPARSERAPHAAVTAAGPVRQGAPLTPRVDAAHGDQSAAPADESSAEPAAEAPAADEPAALTPEPADESLVDELTLLRRARAALARKQPAQALALAKEHASRHPHGTLRQERLATLVLALCGLERTEEARVLARELERVAPRSPHLMRLRASCVTEVLGEVR